MRCSKAKFDMKIKKSNNHKDDPGSSKQPTIKSAIRTQIRYKTRQIRELDEWDLIGSSKM